MCPEEVSFCAYIISWIWQDNKYNQGVDAEPAEGKHSKRRGKPPLSVDNRWRKQTKSKHGSRSRLPKEDAPLEQPENPSSSNRASTHNGLNLCNGNRWAIRHINFHRLSMSEWLQSGQQSMSMNTGLLAWQGTFSLKNWSDRKIIRKAVNHDDVNLQSLEGIWEDSPSSCSKAYPDFLRQIALLAALLLNLCSAQASHLTSGMRLITSNYCLQQARAFLCT